jgi:repressor LexA
MLTERQKRVLDFIRGFIRDYSVPPTVREIGSALGFGSTGTTRDYLRALEKKGFLRLKKGMARGIELLAPAVGVPLVGRVSAGKPIEAVENIEGYMDISGIFPEKDGLFLLRVNGESMRDAGILAGDLAVVKRTDVAENRDIVVAMIGDEAVIKRFFKLKHGIKLESAHPHYPPIVRKDVRIIGKVVGIIRRYNNS